MGSINEDRNAQARREGIVQSGLLKSLREYQFAEWSRYLETGEAHAVFGRPETDFCQNLFAEAVVVTKRACKKEELQAVSSMLESLISRGITRGRGLKTAVETCIIACQQRLPRAAIRLATESLNAKVQLKAKTTLVTMSLGIQQSRNPDDLREVLTLFQVAVHRSALSLDKPETRGVFNVILAATCDPRVVLDEAHRRIGPQYELETSIFDAAQRLRVAVGFAQTVVASGIRFVTPQDEGRINLTVRGFVSVGYILALEAGWFLGTRSNEQVRTSLAQLGLARDYPRPVAAESQGPDWQMVAYELLSGALDICCHCFSSREDSDLSVLIDQCYKLRGLTVGRLFTALEKSEMVLTELQRDEVTALLFCALSVKECRDEISAASIQSAVRLVSSGQSDPIVRAERLACIIPVALDKIKEVSLLNEVIDILAGAAIQNPSLDERYVPLVASIEARLEQLRLVKEKSPSQSGARDVKEDTGGAGWFSKLLEQHDDTTEATNTDN